MPLHLIFQCCKCKGYLSHDLWSIARNHKYADSKYVCCHFNVIIDHESSWGFGFAWRNEIKIKAECKIYPLTKTVLSQTFNRNCTEHEDYAIFNNIVCHARISDYRNNFPSCGDSIQRNIEYNERREQERREEMERRQREEMERQRRMQYERDLTLQLDNMIERGRTEEEQAENELTILREESNKKKKKFKSRIKIMELDIEKIFESMYDITIEKY